MTQYVPSEHLWTEFNGKLEFEYDHSIYWPAMLQLAEERREARKARWIAGGKQIGELEDYLSGSLEQGVAPPAKVENQPEATAEKKVDDLKMGELIVNDKEDPEDESTSVKEGEAEDLK